MGNVILRILEDKDKKQLFSIANNKNIWLNLRDVFPHPYTENDADVFINLVKNETPKLTFAIEFDKQLCGIIGLTLLEDVYKKNAELGYWVGEQFWSKGIASEAVKKILDYGFNHLKIKRVFASIFGSNLGSIKVLEKNNFIKEGVFKNAIYKNNTFFDEYRFAILKEDFQKINSNS